MSETQKTEMNLKVGERPSTEELQKEHDDAVAAFKAIGEKAVKFSLPSEAAKPTTIMPGVAYLTNEIHYSELGEALDIMKSECSIEDSMMPPIVEIPLVVMADGTRKAFMPKWNVTEFEVALLKIRCRKLVQMVKDSETKNLGVI